MKIVFLDRYSLGDSDLSEIAKLGEYVEYEDTKPEEVVERCQGADAIISNKVNIMQKEMDALPSLKLICVAATGINNVDAEYAAKKGIQIKNVPAYSTQSVTEATFSMVLSLLRNTIYYDQYVKSGSYAASGKCFHHGRTISQISGKRWGIIGLGNIGQRVALLAETFGAEVWYYSTSGQNKDAGYKSVDLDTLLSECDIISIHSPLNKQTEGLIGYHEIKKMKPTGVLINVGRGKIVDEEGLAKALDKNLIAGAGLDVYEFEPMKKDNPLLTVKDPYKLVLAPHSAWSSAEARRVLVGILVSNIKETFNI